MNVDIIQPEQDSGRVRLIGAAKYIKVKLMKLVTLVTLERLTQALLIMAMIAFAIRILSASGISRVPTGLTRRRGQARAAR